MNSSAFADLIPLQENVATQRSRSPKSSTDANSHSLNSSTPIKYEPVNSINFYVLPEVALNQ